MQRRHTWMTFHAEHKGYPIELSCQGEVAVQFSCGALVEPNKDGNRTYYTKKSFSTLEALLIALDKYDLKLRKNFENNLAFYIPHDTHMGVQTVEVTSITEDGREAWVKMPPKRAGDETRREKVPIKGHLFSDRAACEAFVRLKANLTKTYADTKLALQEELEKEFQWVPQFAAEKAVD